MLIKQRHDLLPIRGPQIPVGRKFFAYVDQDDYEKENHYYWRPVFSGSCLYAVRRVRCEGKTLTIRMHNEIMQTPEDMECHHRNRNSLDNRKTNLENLTPSAHRAEHGKT